MATTTNYSWTTPDDTDLVKDGAAAIRTLGSSADTTVKNLNPGTTAGDIDYYTSSTAKARVAIGTANQVLQVNSGGTAPEWGVDPVADVITTAGDLIYGTAADTVARLGIGTAGQVLQVNSGATAPEWATASGGGLTYAAYTPTFANFTLGNGTIEDSRWAQSGEFVHFWGRVKLGSTSSVTGEIQITLPVQSAYPATGRPGGAISLGESGVGGYAGAGTIAETTLNLRAVGTSGTFATTPTTNATSPFTWGTNDTFAWSVYYEVV